ncbi:zinc finger BED domain-containing protein RICESLEEPER 2-like [Setaria italica]|uniref:zinc finger BED domain-containing protein RICESLEEPER 2-like n=1 Tax=Setaria italica TaxID=4555 RepID=UPI000BE5C652|nr:zinc finger BED domain-containing protein RICESLEEPER 2-like [Setaria italica]
MGTTKAKCMYCFKKLSGETNHETKHLHDHLKLCTLRKIKTTGNKSLSQSCLRFGSTESGTVQVENYTFDQEVARKELAAIIILHEYPLSMVDHAGFRRFASALQPLFKMGTRNTIRKIIVMQYEMERKKAIEYMASIDSRVAITSDLWTSDNQKMGYMAVTAHFIDESWTLTNIIMRFIYVPAPHTSEVIAEELYESLVDWNLDEKISTITLDNCTTNDAAIPYLDGLEHIKTAIENIRESVAYWTTTPKRIEKFEEIAKFVKDKVAEIIDLLTELMIEYHVEEDCDNSESAAAAAPTEDIEFLSSFSARVASTRPSAVRFKSELDRYLEDELVSLETKGFKVLDWWKVAGLTTRKKEQPPSGLASKIFKRVSRNLNFEQSKLSVVSNSK